MSESQEYPLPVRSIEWEITSHCNYSCDYCIQKTYLRLYSAHTSEAVMNAVSDLLHRSAERWLVKLMGGEPFVHPRFFDIVKMLRQGGHALCTTTNFSVPIRVLSRFIDECGDGLDYITASFHPGQVRSLSEFAEKARRFQELKHPTTRFTVTAVALESHEMILRELTRACDGAGIPLEFSPYKIRARYARYKQNAFRDFIEPRLLSRSGEIRGRSVFGTMCHTGEMFARVTVEGDVVRCYNLQPGFYLGNLLDGSFSWFPTARPCLATRCTCTVPVERNMVEFGNRLPWVSAAARYVSTSFTRSPNALGFAGKWVGRFARYASKHPVKQLFRR